MESASRGGGERVGVGGAEFKEGRKRKKRNKCRCLEFIVVCAVSLLRSAGRCVVLIDLPVAVC